MKQRSTWPSFVNEYQNEVTMVAALLIKASILKDNCLDISKVGERVNENRFSTTFSLDDGESLD